MPTGPAIFMRCLPTPHGRASRLFPPATPHPLITSSLISLEANYSRRAGARPRLLSRCYRYDCRAHFTSTSRWPRMPPGADELFTLAYYLRVSCRAPAATRQARQERVACLRRPSSPIYCHDYRYFARACRVFAAAFSPGFRRQKCGRRRLPFGLISLSMR